jgi:hypothetical protein
MEFGLRYVYARKLRKVLTSNQFQILFVEEYVNEQGQMGMEYVCDYRSRRFYCSESKTDLPSNVAQFEMVLRDPKEVSTTVPLVWPNRHGEPCLYIEVWSTRHWYKFHTPLKCGPLDDEFSDLVAIALKEGSQPT